MRSLVGPPAAASAPGIQAPEGASSTWSAARVVAHIESHLHTSRIGFSREIDPSISVAIDDPSLSRSLSRSRPPPGRLPGPWRSCPFHTRFGSMASIFFHACPFWHQLRRKWPRFFGHLPRHFIRASTQMATFFWRPAPFHRRFHTLELKRNAAEILIEIVKFQWTCSKGNNWWKLLKIMISIMPWVHKFLMPLLAKLTMLDQTFKSSQNNDVFTAISPVPIMWPCM